MNPESFPGAFPVFRLEPSAATPAFIQRLKENTDFLGSDDHVANNFQICRLGTRRLDIYLPTSEVWMASDALWMPDFEHGVSPDTPPPDTTSPEDPDEYLRQAGLPRFSFVAEGVIGPGLTDERKDTVAVRRFYDSATREWIGNRRSIKLDTHVQLTTTLTVPDPFAPGGVPITAPLIGPRVGRGMTFDPAGTMIAFHGAAPQSIEQPHWLAAVSMEESQQTYLHQFEGLGTVSLEESSLAYEICESPDGTWLQPVWRHRARLALRGRDLVLPIASLPASSFYAGIDKAKCELTVPLPQGPLATGAWWLGGKDIHAQRNAENFLCTMRDANWSLLARRGNDRDAKEDWLPDSVPYGVEATDLAYYVGHADCEGWEFDPNFLQKFRLTTTDVADMQRLVFGGANRLKWVALCACGPLQDDVIHTGGDAFENWKAAFDGIHALLGFGDRIGARPKVGERFAERMGTDPLIDAWLAAARQTGETSYAAAMWVFDAEGHSARGDRTEPLSVATLSGIAGFVAIWTPA